VTQYEIELATYLGRLSFLPGSAQKRFARDIAFHAATMPDKEISLRQRHYMELMAWRYRRQLPSRFVPETKPLNLPPKVKLPRKPYRKPRPMRQTNDQATLL
jgi:hypothetical protein